MEEIRCHMELKEIIRIQNMLDINLCPDDMREHASFLEGLFIGMGRIIPDLKSAAQYLRDSAAFIEHITPR